MLFHKIGFSLEKTRDPISDYAKEMGNLPHVLIFPWQESRNIFKQLGARK